MKGKKEAGLLKKVSIISLLVMVIAMVIVFGVIGVSAGDKIHNINITEPGSVTNKSPVNFNGTILYINGSIDESIINATLTYGSEKVTIPVNNGEFSYPITLAQGENIIKIEIETEGELLNTSHEVTYNPLQTEEGGEGFAIPDWVIPWVIVALIVVLSFLIFFVITEKTEDELFIYAIIFWIAYAIIIPIVLFIVHRLELGPFEFEGHHMIIAIIAALSLPLLFALVHAHTKGKKEKSKVIEYEPEEREWESKGVYDDYFNIQFEVLDEKDEQPIINAKISVSKSGSDSTQWEGSTNQDGICKCELPHGEYKYKIKPVDPYRLKLGKLSAERSGIITIHLSQKTGDLTVQVKDIETGNSIPGANVSVSGIEKRTDKQGKVLFSGVTIGEKEIKVEEIKGVYSSGKETCEIKEDDTTEVSVSIKSLLHIPIDKESKFSALRNQLQDNYRRVSSYDPCIPFYYKSSVDNLVELIKGIVDTPMLFVGTKNPEETIGHLVDAIDLTSHEIIEVMTSKRNVDVYSAAM